MHLCVSSGAQSVEHRCAILTVMGWTPGLGPFCIVHGPSTRAYCLCQRIHWKSLLLQVAPFSQAWPRVTPVSRAASTCRDRRSCVFVCIFVTSPGSRRRFHWQFRVGAARWTRRPKRGAASAGLAKQVWDGASASRACRLSISDLARSRSMRRSAHPQPQPHAALATVSVPLAPPARPTPTAFISL